MGLKASPLSSSTYFKLLLRKTEPITKEACVSAMAVWHFHIAMPGGAAAGRGWGNLRVSGQARQGWGSGIRVMQAS